MTALGSSPDEVWALEIRKLQAPNLPLDHRFIRGNVKTIINDNESQMSITTRMDFI